MTRFVSADASLILKRFGVAYGDRVVLSDVSIEVPSRGLVTLVGPTGTGKSTLLRTLAGFNRHLPSVHTWGDAAYQGKPLSETNSPVLVSQNTRLLTSTLLENLLYYTAQRFASTPQQKQERALQELRTVGLDRYADRLSRPVVELPQVAQRLVALARAIASDASLVLIDEPTFGIEPPEAEPILQVIHAQSAQRAILLVMHNQRQVRALGGTTALLAGGVVQEVRPTEQFFSSPNSTAAREFVETGTCADPSPSARDEDLDTGIRERLRRAPADASPPSQTLGPRGFVWLFPGKLAGTPRPGVIAELDADLEALTRVGVSVLISLTSTPVDAAALARFRLTAHWFPVTDMHAPTIDRAAEICALLDRILAEGRAVAVHCRAGHGRTGTVLVAYLIWQGRTAMDALETARRFEPRWVQSDRQIRFLEEFASAIEATRARATANASDARSFSLTNA